MVPLPMLKLETKSFDLSLVDRVIDIPVENKRFQRNSGSVGFYHISYNIIQEKEH